MVYDVIAIGGSAGAIGTLRPVVSSLPSNLAAAVFVVVHTAPERPNRLAEVLTQYGALPASAAVHGERIQKGHIYVAPSDNHLSVQGEYIRVVRGPRENGHRPSIDVLFRSAAREFGPRVIGVLLSGQQDCGTTGMMAIAGRGGLTIVQDPGEAASPDMPNNVLKYMSVDHILPAVQIGTLLAKLAGRQVRPSRANKGLPIAEVSSKLQSLHDAMRRGEASVPSEPSAAARLSPITCPECQGSLLEASVGGVPRFQCHVGHAYSLDSLAAEQEHALEDALWASIRALQESETLARRMVDRSEPSLSGRFLERAEAMNRHAETIRRILMADRILPGEEENEAASTNGAETLADTEPAH